MNWNHHLRTAVFLGTGAAGFVFAGAAVLVFWWSPASPLLRDEPAILVSAGDIEGASQAYREQATGWGSDSEREQALWRASQLEAIELESRKSAIELLKSFQDAWPQSEHRADAFGLLAELYEPDRSAKVKEEVVHASLRRAAQTWELAAQTDPKHARAGDWLVRSAGIWEELDQSARADATWRKASHYPKHRVAALMAIGNSQLSDAPELAYDAFRKALKHNPELADASLARLGMATALERMERYMDAEEAIDLALSEDLDDPALTQRKRRLEAIR